MGPCKRANTGGVGGKEAAVKDAVKKMEQAAAKKDKGAGGAVAAAPGGASAAATAAVEVRGGGRAGFRLGGWLGGVCRGLGGRGRRGWWDAEAGVVWTRACVISGV